ncbi:hypothetical protein BBAD15_g5995 [Beauveria bassiana D1-5]|uniref:Uncharacterized protein n=1 Tax=Beauveria bassiana D1-5 TaxID=1245745 RepID=A0A0A2VM77_BEABA|nr:hypothetical protein BBAD15_g5995 [Beauveria bassiana D1-5]
MEWLNEEWQQEEDSDNDMHAVQALHHHNSPHHHHVASFDNGSVALDRRSIAGSSTINGPAPSTNNFRSSYDGYRDAPPPTSPPPPPLVPYSQSSPSVVSSLNYSALPSGWSPLYRQPLSPPSQGQVATAITRDAGSSSRNELARRLTFLAQRLTCGGDVDELALAGQLEQMEKAVSPPSSPNPRRRQLSPQQQQRPGPANRPLDPQTPGSPPPRSDTDSVLGSPLSMIRSQFSDLSLASMREREREREQERVAEEERESRARTGIAEAQAKQLIAEANKLNEELSQVAENLKARQEEMENRVSYLEQELDDNDDELQHLRICLKAVEVQLPPNPDLELQRCINVFKEDFRELKRNRANRCASVASSQNFFASTPTTPNPGTKRAASYNMYTTPPSRNDMR